MSAFRLIFVAAAGLGILAGCVPYTEQYIDRRDVVDFSAGNAVEANMVQQIIDPWPLAARNTNIELDGQKAQRAVDRYHKRGPGGSGSSGGGGDSSGGSSGGGATGGAGGAGMPAS